MRRVLTLPTAAIMPSRADVLSGQGIPPGAAVSDRIEALLDAAGDRFAALALPRAVVQAIDRDAFSSVLHGDDFEPSDTPVGEIAPRSDGLALFVATLGQEVSDEIEALFAAGDFALGAMLDGVASEAAEVLVVWLERFFRGVCYPAEVREELTMCCVTPGAGWGDQAGATCRVPAGRGSTGPVVLGYSPGYCGWPVTGQRRLFAALGPEEIGVALTSSCLMRPLKSVSGVLVAGTVALHDIGQGFPCCAACNDPSCRARIERVASEVTHGDPEPHRPVPPER